MEIEPMNHEEQVAVGKGVAAWLMTWVGLSIGELGSLLAAILTFLLIIDHLWRRYVKRVIKGDFMKTDKMDLR